MPIFNKKVWKDFAAQYPNRRKLTQVDNDLYNVELAVGEIIEQGNKFEADQFNDLENRIENAFNNINDYIERAESAATEAESYRDDAETHKLKSEGYAVGTQNEIPVDVESPYFHNNSKYYSELTLGYKNESAEYSRNSATNAATASANASDAVSAKNAAISNKLMAEGFAIGTQNGVPVDPQSPYYHNNSKYYSEQTSKDDIRDIVNIYGAKNLLDYTEKCNTTTELSGIEFSILDDGSINASGTATSFVKFNLIDKGLTPDDTCIYIPNNTYSLSDVLVTPGCRVEIGIAFYESGSITQHLYTINSNDGNRNITVNAINNDAYISLLDIQVDDETVLNNRVFKPMLRTASISDNTYVKYAMTNAELTKRHTIEGLNNTEIHDLEDGQTTVYNESSNKWENGYPNKVKLNKDEWGEVPGFDYYTNYYYDSNNNYTETDSQVTKISGSNPITETVQYNVPIGWSDMFIRIDDSIKLNEMVGKTIEFGAVAYEYTYQNENILSLKYSVNGEIFNVFSSETGQGSSDLLFNTNGVAIQLVVPENCDYIEMHYISSNSTQVTTAGTATIGNVYAFDINENIIPDENNTSVEFNRYTNEPILLNDNSINFIKNNKEIVVVNNLGEKTVFGKNKNTESIDDIFNIYSSKNLLPFPYQDGDTKTVGGVTFEVSQKDYLATQSGYVCVTSAIRMYGTQTNATEYVIYDQNSPYPLNKGNYKLVSRFIKQDVYGDQISGDIFITLKYYDGNTNTITVTNNNSGTFQINNSEQSGIKSIKLSTLNFVAPQPTSRDEAYAAIMICSESIEDTTYLPPTYTNFQLSEKIDNLTSSELNDTNFVNLQEKQVPAWDSTNDEWYNMSLGTASELDVATSGDASTTQVVKGDDTRLTNARPASDVSAWAKESTKPSYTATEVGAIASTEKGSNNGVATLDSTGKVPSSQLPSYVDDVLEYEDFAHFPVTGETGKIYVAKDTNKQYRWSGSTYVEISESLALGETSSTAYAGNKGKANADNIAVIQGLIPSSASTSNKLATSEDIPSLTNYVEKSSTSGLIKNDGTIDTNQYLTSTDISGKADKSEMSVTNGTGTDADKVTIQLKSGTSTTVLKSHQDVSSLQPKTLETPITVGGQSQTTVQNALSALASEDTGHVIEDKSGTDMTQRTNLQFTGNVNVSDDNTNNRTVVEILDDNNIHNILPVPYADKDKTENGITWHVDNTRINGAGIITARGTSTGETTFYLVRNFKPEIVWSNEEDGSNGSFDIDFYMSNTAALALFGCTITLVYRDSSMISNSIVLNSSNLSYHGNWSLGSTISDIFITIPSGVTLPGTARSPFTFPIMLVQSSMKIDDDVYHPYIMSPREITKKFNFNDLHNTNFTNLQDGEVPAWDATNNEWHNVQAGSGGGHVISDKSGTVMTQRDGLQFGGYLETTDDSTNNKTIVSDAPNTVTYDTWVNMTSQQKSGKKWLITNAPETPVSNLQPKILDTPVVVGGQTQTTVQSALSALATSGGGGGHTIEDSTGTAMTQRTNLKFAGATVTDDSTNNATIVSIPNMVVLSYGHSTWTDFINAYNSNTVVYCRASSNASNPGTGNQTRLAFMAYVNNASSPTEVEFQYYRSVGTKSASQQGDQVFVYKLNKQSSGAYTWSFLVRPTFTEVVSGNGVTVEYNNSQLKLDTPAIAPSFSTSTSYVVDDMVFYEGNLYTFTTAHSAGAWNANDVVQVTVGEELTDLKESVDTVENNISSILSLYNTKNLLNMESQSGSFVPSSNMTFTVNADNSVTLNGDTGTYNYNIAYLLPYESSFVEKRHIPKGRYVFSSLGDLMSDSPKFRMYMVLMDGSNYVDVYISNYGQYPTEATFNIASDTAYIMTIQMQFDEQTSVSNKTIYPMLRAAGTDDVYVPFTKTNRQLTNEVNYLNQMIGPATAERVTLTDESSSAAGFASCYKYSNGLVRVLLRGLPIPVQMEAPDAMNLISGLPTPLVPTYEDLEFYIWANVRISGGSEMAPILLEVTAYSNKICLRYLRGIPSEVSMFANVALYGDLIYWSNS